MAPSAPPGRPVQRASWQWKPPCSPTVGYAACSQPRITSEAQLNFLFLLTAGPRSESVHTVAALVRAAGQAGHHAEVFLAGDGVAHAATLAGAVPVTLCDADLRWRQTDLVEVPGVRRGSLRDLAIRCRDADRILVFR